MPRALTAQSILSKVPKTKPHHDATTIHHNWLYRHVALPVLALLRMGATPEKLAWSIAVGLLIGINPILGSTTVVCLAAAFALRLNVAASQLGNHVVYPLQLILVIPLIRLGSRFFHTAPMPLSGSELLRAARQHPVALLEQLWRWEWHALVVWAIIAALAIPLAAFALIPLLRRLLRRVERRQYPILTGASEPEAHHN